MTFADDFADGPVAQEVLPLVGEFYYLGRPNRGIVRVPAEKLGLERSFFYEEDGKMKSFFGKVEEVKSGIGETYVRLIDRKNRRVTIPASIYVATHLEKNIGVFVPSMHKIDGVEDLSD